MNIILERQMDSGHYVGKWTDRQQNESLLSAARQWVDALKTDELAVRIDFDSWVRQSPEHFGAFLQASARDFVGREKPKQIGDDDTGLVEAIAARTQRQNQLYIRYRRPLLQVFLHRRIPRDAAEDLLQRTFLQAIKKIRTEGLDDSSRLGGYLYRTASKLATAYWRDQLARKHDNDLEILEKIEDKGVSLEEQLNHAQLAQSVRELMVQLPERRDREVLERYYLREESPAAVRDAMQLSEEEFKHMLWRARQRFGDILQRNGLFKGQTSA